MLRYVEGSMWVRNASSNQFKIFFPLKYDVVVWWVIPGKSINNAYFNGGVEGGDMPN